VTETHTLIPETPSPSRRASIDWASVSSYAESDPLLNDLRNHATTLVSDVSGFHDRVPMKRPGNFLHGESWKRFGAEIKWSSHTAAALAGAHPEGRCVGHVNVCLRGGSGVGAWTLPRSLDLLSQLRDVGFQSVPRLDLALDLFDWPHFTVRLLVDELKAGRWKIPRRNPDAFTIHGPLVPGRKRDGLTLYIGSRTDAKRVIVYDKAAEKGLERSWLRVEVQLHQEVASEALWRLVEAHNSAMQTTCPDKVLADAHVALVRSAFDVRDVSALLVNGRLPQNWVRSPKASLPELMHPLYGETAPIDIGSFKAVGTWASRFRHAQRSSAKFMWTLAVISEAKGDEPGAPALLLGSDAYGQCTDEDWDEIARMTGIAPGALADAEAACLNKVAELKGMGPGWVETDRTMRRQQVAVSYGGV
jgi:hypothetical protein